MSNMKYYTSQKGFTLIEILMATALSSIVIAGVYQLFHSQQRSYIIQDQLAEMQQNLRAGMYLMVKDIRSLGYDPEKSGNFGFVTDLTNDILSTNDINYNTDKSRIAFTIDDDGDGILDSDISDDDKKKQADKEQIIYRLNGTNIEKYSFVEGNWQTISTNVDALDFVYLDVNGMPIVDVNANFANIRAVEISVLVRTGKADANYSSTQVYKNKQEDILCSSCSSDPYLRKFRRRLLSTTVQVRNL
jgi:type IV pilus assembly protein PilW